jgi:hypothetical protein
VVVTHSAQGQVHQVALCSLLKIGRCLWSWVRLPGHRYGTHTARHTRLEEVVGSALHTMTHRSVLDEDVAERGDDAKLR